MSEEKLNNEIQGDANRKMGGKEERKKVVERKWK